MIREFEGKTRAEAIEKAIAELGLNQDELDVEILEEGKGLFKKGPVKIRVVIEDESSADEEVSQESSSSEVAPAPKVVLESDEKTDIILDFLEELLEKMGYPGECSIYLKEDNKIGINIVSNDSGIIIGKKGKNLDAIQLLVNVFAGKLDMDNVKFLLDIEDYRNKREKSLESLAERTAIQVQKSKGSRLLDQMNPYERRIIHTTLNEYDDIHTVSEGEGLYKRVRVFFQSNN